MKRLRNMLDRVEPLFVKGGRLENFHAIYEMVDTLFYSPPDVTRGSPHIRDAIDLKRVMIIVVFAATPATLVGMWNTGFQAHTAMLAMGIEASPGWRETILSLLGAGHNPASLYDNLIFGLSYFLPMYIVTMAAGGFWEVLFAGIRNHEINEGFFVTSLLYVLILPATIPLWQVAVGISAIEGMSGVVASGLTWTQAFFGQMQGSFGETSTAACLIGAVIIMYTGVGSWRIIVATFAGLIIPVLLTSSIESSNPMLSMPWHWHVVLGGFAFGAVFMATDPVSATQTNAGRWVYGLLIGFMTWVIRVINPAFPEGIMLAILFANVFAPMIDYFVVRANIKRRVQRSV